MKKETLPLVLKAPDIAKILGISERSAYDVMKREGFPLKKIGNRKYVTKDKFFEWLENDAS